MPRKSCYVRAIHSKVVFSFIKSGWADFFLCFYMFTTEQEVCSKLIWCCGIEDPFLCCVVWHRSLISGKKLIERIFPYKKLFSVFLQFRESNVSKPTGILRVENVYLFVYLCWLVFAIQWALNCSRYFPQKITAIATSILDGLSNQKQNNKRRHLFFKVHKNKYLSIHTYR